MKAFAIVISFAFLGIAHSVSDANPIGGSIQGSLCSAVTSVNICPSHTLPCSYEGFNNEGPWSLRSMYPSLLVPNNVNISLTLLSILFKTQ